MAQGSVVIRHTHLKTTITVFDLGADSAVVRMISPGPDSNVAPIPRVGETMWIDNESWTVRDVSYHWGDMNMGYTMTCAVGINVVRTPVKAR